MKHADFAIGTEFEISAGQRWRCTDVGQRTITAIELDPELDEAWFNGPPFAVPEVVFDEIEMENAYRSLDEAFRNRMAEIDSLPHPGFPHEVISTIITAQLSDASRGYPSGRLLDSIASTSQVRFCIRMPRSLPATAGAFSCMRRSRRLSAHCQKRNLSACGLQHRAILRHANRRLARWRREGGRATVPKCGVMPGCVVTKSPNTRAC